MIKIAINVRNRLAVTKKCIQAIYEYSELDFQLYIYDNLSNHNLKDHFEYFWKLYEKGMITQVTFNTKDSTFDAFSKAAALNQFGHNHEQDPRREEFLYLMFLDNDMLVMPGWDTTLRDAWNDVNKLKMSNIKVICQHPGGMKSTNVIPQKMAGHDSVTGKFGGSGFWSVRTDFYRDVGFLKMKSLVGLNKKHDQNYWKMLAKSGKDYVLGLKTRMVIDTGGFSGSVCNVIGYGGVDAKKMEKIKYVKRDAAIEQMTFQEFYQKMKARIPIPKQWKKIRP